jgi:hypothetical protein
MRIATIAAWVFVGFGLMLIGALLYVLQISEYGKLARFVAVMGGIYFCIGIILTLMHDRHMARRTQAGRE